MTTWEQRLAESERRQKAENILYALKSYFEAKSGLEKAYSDFLGSSPGYFLSSQQDEVETSAVEALDALEALIDERVSAALAKREG